MDNWAILPFERCINKISISKNIKISKKDYLPNGKIPIIDQGKSFISGYSNDELFFEDFPAIIFGDHTCIFKYVDFPFLLGADGTKIIVPKRDLLNTKYFYYYLRSLKIKNQGYKRHYKFLKERDIIIPPLDIQKQIVNKLEKIEELISYRNKSLEELDSYLKSVFLEMFGTPYINSKSFAVDLLGNIATFKSGGTPSRKNEEYYKGDIPWITTISLGPLKINRNDAVEYITQKAIDESATKLIPKESVIIGTRVGVGKVSINTCPICTNQDIVSLVNIDSSINKIFLVYMLNFYKDYFDYCKRGATIKGITTTVLKSLEIPVPPIELQNQFAEIVKQVEEIKKYQLESKKELENLFNNLMQKAFKGELIC